jgi:type IV secretory pathway VirB3-like protein
MNIMQGVAVSVAGISGGLLALLYAFQENLLYLPSVPAREYGEDPSDHLMPYDDVELVADDGVRLHAWLIKRPESQNAATFVYFHGNTYSPPSSSNMRL